MRWLVDMRAVYEPDLAVLLSPDRELTPGATAAVVARWRRAGVATASRLFVGSPRLVRLTAAGAVRVGAERWNPVADWTARHAADVSRGRLWMEARQAAAGRPLQAWIPERRFRRDQAAAIRAGAHVPDGIAVLPDGGMVAVEVERTDKGVPRTAAILTELMRAYPDTVYLTRDPQIAATVRTAVERAQRDESMRLGTAQWGRVRVFVLPDQVRAGEE